MSNGRRANVSPFSYRVPHDGKEIRLLPGVTIYPHVNLEVPAQNSELFCDFQARTVPTCLT